MQLSNSPGKLVLPFAASGNKNSIPVTSQIGITPGAASLADGFPPLTMTPVAAGGVPPSGLDMNGIFYEMSAIVRWANAGGGYEYDGTFATDPNVGGYPKGARVMRTDGRGYWINTADNNTTNPETSGAAAAGWVPDYTNGSAAITMTSANVTLTPLQYGKPIIVISGALTANLNLIFPDIIGQWSVINNTTGAYSITCKTAGGIGVIATRAMVIIGDATNILLVSSNTITSAEGFGAVGDGATDDRSAIQSAIEYLHSIGGGALWFSNKTFSLSSRLYWRDNVILYAPGGKAVLKIQNGVDSPVIGIVGQQTTPAIVNIGAIGIVFDGNSTNSPGAAAYSGVILDPVNGGYFERCEFRNARGYGASLQYPATEIPDNNRIKDITFVRCDFHNNGIGLATPGTLYDGIDVKNCDGLTFIRCRSYSNALDGFDFRGDNIELIACEAFGNGGSGLEISANSGGNWQNSSVRVIGGHYHSNVNGVGIANDPAGGSGLTRVTMLGTSVRANTGAGIKFFASNTNTHASMSDVMIFANGGSGVDILGAAEQIALSGCQIVANVGDGIYCNAASCVQINGGLLERNVGWGYREGASATRNNLAGPLRIVGNTAGHISLNAASMLTKVSASVLDHTPGGSEPSDIIPSAATITLPAGGETFFVTGTTGIASITASSRGRVVSIQFTDELTVTDGENLRLASAFTTTANDTLTLMCNGVNWFEVSRSVN